jgi:hypothetical protein
MPIIYIKNNPLAGASSVFDNLVGYQLVTGGGLTFGTFEFTPSIFETNPRKFETNVFDAPVSLESLGINDIGDVKTAISKQLDVYPNYDITQVMNFVMYGSLSKRFSVSITNVINNFPASIDVNFYDNNLNTGYTATNIVYDAITDDTTFDINIEKIYNPFGVDFSQNSAINLLANEIAVSEYRDLTKYYVDYVLSINGVVYPLVILNPSESLTEGTLTITVSGSPFGVSSSNSVQSFIIRPSDFLYNLVLKSQLDELEQFMLNTLSSPIYTMTLQVPQENDNGQFTLVDTNITFPLDGVWNIDILSESFSAYLDNIQVIANYFDNARTNLISRFFVSDSLKEFDTFDRRIESMLQIYGRSFDEVKKFIDSLAYMNSVNYTPKNDIPSQLLVNLGQTLGWQENFQFLTDQTLIESIFGDNSDFKYPAYNRSQTPLELNYSFYRNLVINSFYLFKSKGTRRSIEFILRLFGAPEALVEFNEHIYIADQKINLTKFNSDLSKIQTGNYIDNDPVFSASTYTLSGYTYTAITENTTSLIVNFNTTNYPLDRLTGYPKQPKDSDQLFFQMGAGWYQLTPKHKSLEIATRTGVAPNIEYGTEFEPFTYGNKYLNIFRKFPYIDEGFTLSKYVDNKKSWSRDNTLMRVSVDGSYNAYYFVSDERLLLNVKNTSIFLNPSQGLLYDVWVQSNEYDYPIPQSGLTFPYATTGGTDATEINPQPKSKSFFEFAATFAKNMINVRNRMYINDGKTGGYPTLQSIFWKYIESPYTVNIPTNKYTYEKLIKFVEGINPYWIKLVEQMIPATTLWMGGLKFENSIFHKQKYVYKRVMSGCTGNEPKVITASNIDVYISSLTPIASGDEFITSPIFSDICIKNGISLVATPLETFPVILGNAIGSTIEELDLSCDGTNVLTSWYSEIVLNSTIVAKVKFYDGIGNDDVPTNDLWQTSLINALSNLYYYDINYTTPINGVIKFIDLDCVDEIATNKLLTINVGVDVNIIC